MNRKRMAVDDIRPKGTVQLECIKCEWSFWVDPLHPMLETGEHICASCASGDHFEGCDCRICKPVKAGAGGTAGGRWGVSGEVHIHAPKSETTIRVLKCSTCKKRRKMRVDMYEWYDPTATCGTCGETWTGGERHERPFEPGWRKKNVAYAQTAIKAFAVPPSGQER